MIDTIAIAQAGTGTTTLYTPDADKTVHVLNYTVLLDDYGTFQFTDGTEALSGPMPILQYGGAAPSAGSQGAGNGPQGFQRAIPLMKCKAAGRPIKIVTTGGAASGHICIEVL